MPRRVQDIDRGWAGLKAQLRSQLEQTIVTVGVHGDEQGDDGTSMALIASVHEFGSARANVPARSFIRSTFDDKRSTYEGMLRRVAAVVMAGAPLRQGLALVGARVQADIQNRIRAGISPALAPSTIDRRLRRNGGRPQNDRFSGFTPLIDTGRLINSIRYVVERRRGA